ncbi:hypothetical protein RBA41_28710 [Massilia sp. CCM 9210]|uniref:hypothetical protein n=1 Tax=Massilia scottii TaxID=3057166 RepID=UPI002796D07B|nr:hypothetical protein [Massilia sp. CCM 9210]MDQ1817294.1 hypothetical protein [Massilia sp. CCM 9210]
MTTFAKYDIDGRVLFHGDVPKSMIALQGDRVFVGDIDGRTHYVRDGHKYARPANPALLVGLDLTQLPMPCDVVINDKTYPCGDGRATLSFKLPGRYRVRVVAFPFLDANFEIQA